MKNFILLSISFFLIFYGCDKIENPISIVQGNADGLCTEPSFPINPSTKRNILVEDLNGHKCTWCPSAAYSIDTIKQSLDKQMIPVGIHVTDEFASVNPADAPKYQTNFKTEGGTEIYNKFTPGVGLPAVMVNRKLGFTSDPNRYHVFLSSLSSNIRSLINEVPKVKLQTLSNFNSTTNRVCVFAEIEILASLTDDHSIVFMLLEDSIVDYQKYSGSGGDPIYGSGARDINDYVHKHVLRKSMNGWEGKKIIEAGSSVIGEKIVEGSTFVITDGSWRTNHLEIVAFVYNNTTKEVIQAYSEKL